MFLNQVYEISMSTVIKMECDDCSPGKLVEEETISHIREKVTICKYSKPLLILEIIGKHSKPLANIQNHWQKIENYCHQIIKLFFLRLSSATLRRPPSLLYSMSLAQPGEDC